VNASSCVANARTRTRTRTRTCAHTLTRKHTHMHVHTHAHAQANTHARAHTWSPDGAVSPFSSWHPALSCSRPRAGVARREAEAEWDCSGGSSREGSQTGSGCSIVAEGEEWWGAVSWHVTWLALPGLLVGRPSFSFLAVPFIARAVCYSSPLFWLLCRLLRSLARMPAKYSLAGTASLLGEGTHTTTTRLS